MKLDKKSLIIFGLVLGGGIIVSLLLALAFGDMKHIVVNMSNGLFMAALLVCVTGAAKTLLPFFRLKSKLLKMRAEDEADLTEVPKYKWEYPVIAAGIILIALSYLLAI